MLVFMPLTLSFSFVQGNIHCILNSLKNLYFLNEALMHLLTTYKTYKFEVFFLTWDINEVHGIKQISLTL